MINKKIEKLDKYVFETILDVRVADLNYGNHLGHDKLISLFHEARMRLFRKHGFTELDVGGLGILITSLSVNYKNEAFYADSIKIKIGLGEIKRTSVEFIYEANLLNESKEIATAMITVTFYDYKKFKVSKIPDIFLKKIGNLN